MDLLSENHLSNHKRKRLSGSQYINTLFHINIILKSEDGFEKIIHTNTKFDERVLHVFCSKLYFVMLLLIFVSHNNSHELFKLKKWKRTFLWLSTSAEILRKLCGQKWCSVFFHKMSKTAKDSFSSKAAHLTRPSYQQGGEMALKF